MRGTDCAQLEAAALVADPTRDPDRQIEREIILELARAAGEAMRDPADQGRAVLGEDGREILVRVALVQKHRLARAAAAISNWAMKAARCAARGEKSLK